MGKIIGISNDNRVVDEFNNYELKDIDTEIVRLTNKEKPNFLFLSHALSEETEEKEFLKIEKIYRELFNCNCKLLKRNDLENGTDVKSIVDWADIIYTAGGDTLNLVYLWKKTGFDKILEEAYNNGKVMCGASSGASCWFNSCITDALRIIYNDQDKPLVGMNCLSFIDLFCIPHGNKMERYIDSKDLLKRNNKVGLLLSSSTSIEIVDDKFRILCGNQEFSDNKVIPFALKMYWDEDKYMEEAIDLSNEFKSLTTLLRKNKKDKKVKVYKRALFICFFYFT